MSERGHACYLFAELGGGETSARDHQFISELMHGERCRRRKLRAATIKNRGRLSRLSQGQVV